jgi:Transposase IS116/IS110/IS902 family
MRMCVVLAYQSWHMARMTPSPQWGIPELRFGGMRDEPAVGYNSHNSGGSRHFTGTRLGALRGVECEHPEGFLSARAATDSNHGGPVAPNNRDQEFATAAPDRTRIKGVGPKTATAIVAAIGDGPEFKNGRHLAASVVTKDAIDLLVEQANATVEITEEIIELVDRLARKRRQLVGQIR